MKFSLLRFLVKVLSYLVLAAGVYFLFDINQFLGLAGGLFFLGLFVYDLHDFRLRRFFDLFFLIGSDLENDYNLKDDFDLFMKIHKKNTTIINSLKKDSLMSLDVNSSIRDKAKFVELFKELDDSLIVLNDIYSRYSSVAGFSNELSRKAFFLSIGSFINIYLIGRVVSDCSNFNAKLLETKFDSIRSLVRSMVFPSTQVYLRSGFYILRKLKFKDLTLKSFKVSFVEDVLYVNELGAFPLLSTVKYYASLWNLFKRQGVLPVQKNVSMFASKTKVREGRKAMSKADVSKVLEVIQPGDIVLTRQASYLTGFLIPGYWTHASMYMGNKNELKEFFGKDYAEIVDVIDLQFEDRVLLESIGKGVSDSRAEDALLADSIIVLRPKIGVYEKLRAIKFVLGNLNKEYNFTFDFSDEDSFICSELVYKAYSDMETGKQNLNFKVKNVFGNWTFTPQDIFNSFVGGNEKLEMVISFLHNKKFNKVVMGEFKDLKKLK